MHEDELTVACRLMCWVLTATDEALTRVDQQKLGVASGLFHAELALLSAVTTHMGEEARGRGLTDKAIGPLLEAQVYWEFLCQLYPPDVLPWEDTVAGCGPVGSEGILLYEKLRRRNALGRLHRAVVERHGLMGNPRDAVPNERGVAGGGDARESFVHASEHLITAVNRRLQQQDRKR